MKKIIVAFVLALSALLGCKEPIPNDSDRKQSQQQELVLSEATAQTGMPAIKNFRERKLLKAILEMRDQTLTTYTYLAGDDDAKLVFLCTSVGFPLPYSTQYTNPEKPVYDRGDHNGGNFSLPQADPNALFSPSSAEGTWVLCADPAGGDAKPVYVEPRIVVSPFPLGPNGQSAAERKTP